MNSKIIVTLLLVFMQIGCVTVNENKHPYVTIKAVTEKTKSPLQNKKFFIKHICPQIIQQARIKMAEGKTDYNGEFSFRFDKKESYVIELYDKDYLIGLVEFEAKEFVNGQVVEFLFFEEPIGGYKKKSLDDLEKLN